MKRSTRTTKRSIVSSSSSEDEDDKPLVKKLKTPQKSKKNKIPKDSDESSSDSDIENYLQPVDKINLMSSFFDVPKKDVPFEKLEKDIFAGVTRLSDSESELEEDIKEGKKPEEEKMEVISQTSENVAKVAFQRMEDYNKKLEEAKQQIAEYEANKKKNEENVVDISHLLIKGENVAHNTSLRMEDLHSSDFESADSDDGWEEIKTATQEDKIEEKSVIPSDGLQIIVNMPDAVKKKKGVDLVAALKRRLNRIRKENQVYVHKVHLLCMLGHGNFVNSVINKSEILKSALKLLPSEKAYPSNRVDLEYLEKIVKWYKKNMKLNEKDTTQMQLGKVLEEQIERKEVYNKNMLCYIFIAIMRALGIQCRLVMSLQVEPLRPPASELHSLSTKTEETKKASHKQNKPSTSKAITVNTSKIKLNKSIGNGAKAKLHAKKPTKDTKPKEENTKSVQEVKRARLSLKPKEPSKTSRAKSPKPNETEETKTIKTSKTKEEPKKSSKSKSEGKSKDSLEPPKKGRSKSPKVTEEKTSSIPKTKTSSKESQEVPKSTRSKVKEDTRSEDNKKTTKNAKAKKEEISSKESLEVPKRTRSKSPKIKEDSNENDKDSMELPRTGRSKSPKVKEEETSNIPKTSILEKDSLEAPKRTRSASPRVVVQKSGEIKNSKENKTKLEDPKKVTRNTKTRKEETSSKESQEVPKSTRSRIKEGTKTEDIKNLKAKEEISSKESLEIPKRTRTKSPKIKEDSDECSKDSLELPRSKVTKKETSNIPKIRTRSASPRVVVQKSEETKKSKEDKTKLEEPKKASKNTKKEATSSKESQEVPKSVRSKVKEDTKFEDTKNTIDAKAKKEEISSKESLEVPKRKRSKSPKIKEGANGNNTDPLELPGRGKSKSPKIDEDKDISSLIKIQINYDKNEEVVVNKQQKESKKPAKPKKEVIKVKLPERTTRRRNIPQLDGSSDYNSEGEYINVHPHYKAEETQQLSIKLFRDYGSSDYNSEREFINVQPRYKTEKPQQLSIKLFRDYCILNQTVNEKGKVYQSYILPIEKEEEANKSKLNEKRKLVVKVERMNTNKMALKNKRENSKVPIKKTSIIKKKRTQFIKIKWPSKRKAIPQLDGLYDDSSDSDVPMDTSEDEDEPTEESDVEYITSLLLDGVVDSIPQLDGADDAQTKKSKPNLKKLKSSKEETCPKMDKCKKKLKVPLKRLDEVDSENGSVSKYHSPPKKQLDVRNDIVNLIKGRISEQKQIDRSKMVKKPKKKFDSDSDSDYAPEPIQKKYHDSDDEFVPKVKVKKRVSVNRKVLSDSDGDKKEKPKKKGNDVWCEVFLEAEEKWISVDVVFGQIHCVKEIFSRASHPISYVVAWNNDSNIRDISARYCQNFNTVTRKLRVDAKWWEASLKPFEGTKTVRDKEEDDEFERQQLEKPLPTVISEYKNHPLYALERHLLKFEAIYPPEPPILGYVRKEPVFPRSCVYTLHSRDIWLKQAKTVKMGEKPYKTVTARPKYDRLSNKKITGQMLEVFGPWQVEDYDPPTAENGVVPRNAFGNVDLFKPCMLPKKCVHLKLPGLNKIARKLNIDCASAIVGFDFHGGWSHPTYEGFVVCEEFDDQLVAAWEEEQKEIEKKEEEKLDKRVYGNWKRLIKGLLIRERLKKKYDFGEPSGEGKKKEKGIKVTKKRKIKSDSESE